MKRNRYIDEFRFVCSILIICYHFYSYYLNTKSVLFENAYMCDEFFFVISGYYLMDYVKHNENYNIMNYIKKIFKKNWFRFYFSLLISFIISHIINNSLVIIDLLNSISEFLCLDMILPINGKYYSSGVTWYYSATLVCSLIILLAIKIIKRFVDYIYIYI